MRERRPPRAAAAPPGSRPGPAAVLLLLAALSTILVGGLMMRWGPAWYYRLGLVQPAGIVIHHSATEGIVDGHHVSAELIDQWHATRGWGLQSGGEVYHIGYHYVVLPDGTVQPGRPEWMPGAHTVGHNNTIGICLVGDFELTRPTTAQLQATVELLARLMKKHHFDADDVYAHRDLAATACPGKHLEVAALARQAARSLKQRVNPE